MSLQRTPPKTPQTKSESDIATAVLQSDYVNINRNKRPREDNSPHSGSSLHSLNLQEKMTTWQTKQESNMANFIKDQACLMSKLSSDIGEIKAQNVQIQSSNAEIRKSNEEMLRSIGFMNQKFEEIKKEVEALKKERHEQHKYIQSLEQKISDLQRMSRGSGIELRNIPTENSENIDTLTKTVCSVGEVVGLHLTESEIRDIYRLPGKSTTSNTPRPILAEFTTVKTKHAFISAVRTYNKGKGKGRKQVEHTTSRYDRRTEASLRRRTTLRQYKETVLSGSGICQTKFLQVLLDLEWLHLLTQN